MNPPSHPGTLPPRKTLHSRRTSLSSRLVVCLGRTLPFHPTKELDKGIRQRPPTKTVDKDEPSCAGSGCAPTNGRTSAARDYRRLATRASAVVARSGALLLTLALGAGLTSCSFLKPARPTARHFVLTPLPAAATAAAPADSLAVGLGQVKLPAYLFNTSLAVRHGTNEVEYLPSALWAERLDTGFQRVLAANLALVLPTDRVQLGAWQKDAVAAALYVTLEQFDVDAGGRGQLVARWRILSPGGERILKAGGSRLSRQGPPPSASASGAVATLSELVADFSRQLAEALQETTSGQTAPAAR